jgi:hypothetical protein
MGAGGGGGGTGTVTTGARGTGTNWADAVEAETSIMIAESAYADRIFPSPDCFTIFKASKGQNGRY